MLAKITLPFLLVGMSILSLQAEAISTYFKLQEARKTGNKEEAYRLSLTLIEEAKAQMLHHYTFIGNYRAASQSYQDHRLTDCLAQAKEGIAVFEQHGRERNLNQEWYQFSNIGLWELSERCHTAQMRPGEGWRAQRKASELWHQFVNLPYEAGTFDVEAIDKLKAPERARGWRQIGREASYLHEIGQTTEARELLQSAIAQIQKSQLPPSIYSVQLYDALANIDAFIGYKESAIDLELAQIEEIKKLSDSSSRQSMLGARINLVRNRAHFEGPSLESLNEARDIYEEAKASNSRALAAIQRQITSLENLLSVDQNGYQNLEELSKSSLATGDELEAFYLNRNALFIRAKSTDENLDSQFKGLLNSVRATGKKRSEPRIYRNYGDWLQRQERYAEALTVYHEALSLTLAFEWHPMVPILFGKIGLTYQLAGEEKAANNIWLQLDAYLQAHPEIPAQMILLGKTYQLSAFLRAGRNKDADTLVKKAHALPHPGGLKDYWLRDFSAGSITAFKKALASEPTVATTTQIIAANLHPRSLDTVALPGTHASGIFHLINPGSATQPGILTLSGPGVHLAPDHIPAEPSFSGDLTQPHGTIKTPLALAGGTALTLPIAIPFHETHSGEFSLTWTPDQGQATTSKWSVNWGGTTSESVVLDSSDVLATSFIGVPLAHHVGFAKGDINPQTIRLRTDTPLRVEYRNSSGDLIAIDANGDGDFTGQGEFAKTSKDLTAPEITPQPETRTGRIEVWLYPVPDHPWTKTQEIHVELFTGSTWKKFATDILMVTEP